MASTVPVPPESLPKNAKFKKAQAPKKPAASKKTKSSPSHPTFQQMITDAIVALKERTGSSQYAITKYIEEKHKLLPANFKKLVLNSLKKLVAAGRLVKVKNSFKLPSSRSAASTSGKPELTGPAKPTKAATTASQAKAKTATKSRATSAGAKRKAAEKPKSKPAKVGRASVNDKSPGKKLAKPAKKAVAKKPKSVRSPAKKTVVKKAKK